MPPRQRRVASSVPTAPDHQKEILQAVAESNRHVLRLLAGQPPLTARETEILRLVAEGNVCDSTAAKLDTTEQVIKNALRGVRQKIGAATTAEAIATCFRRGWLV